MKSGGNGKTLFIYLLVSVAIIFGLVFMLTNMSSGNSDKKYSEIMNSFDKERHVVGDEIYVTGRVNPEIDVDSAVITVKDETGTTVYESPIDITDEYSEISAIDTTGYTPGVYTIGISVTDTDANEYVKEAELTLEAQKFHVELDSAVKEDGLIKLTKAAD